LDHGREHFTYNRSWHKVDVKLVRAYNAYHVSFIVLIPNTRDRVNWSCTARKCAAEPVTRTIGRFGDNWYPRSFTLLKNSWIALI
jgi:hypothetical protein